MLHLLEENKLFAKECTNRSSNLGIHDMRDTHYVILGACFHCVATPKKQRSIVFWCGKRLWI